MRAEVESEFRELRSVLDEVTTLLPNQVESPANAQDIDGVNFVDVSTHVVVGVDLRVLEAISACLEGVILRGDERNLHSLVGAHFAEVRDMYLGVCGALGRQRHARAVAFGPPPNDL